ncbi:MAG: EscU/YscU/HrcU family type III secretion system export apparatus switch protein [Bacillota bacterium]|nr:EscU/YscU/HrcU family type III secretion system export apparatus switch protein [Bacillota bacterium]
MFRPVHPPSLKPRATGAEPQQAAALRYDPEADLAPRLVAKGRGYVARRILELAQKYGIPVYRDPVLASALAQLEINSLIPPELYRIVAEVLVFVYSLDRSRQNLAASPRPNPPAPDKSEPSSTSR